MGRVSKDKAILNFKFNPIWVVAGAEIENALTISKRKVGGKDLSQGVEPVLGRAAEAPKEIETDIHEGDEKEIENEEGDIKKGKLVEETERSSSASENDIRGRSSRSETSDS